MNKRGERESDKNGLQKRKSKTRGTILIVVKKKKECVRKKRKTK